MKRAALIVCLLIALAAPAWAYVRMGPWAWTYEGGYVVNRGFLAIRDGCPSEVTVYGSAYDENGREIASGSKRVFVGSVMNGDVFFDFEYPASRMPSTARVGVR